MLPSGTLRYLKGQPDAIVTVVLAAMALTALAVGAPVLGTMATVGIVAGFYYARCRDQERHQREMAQIKADEAAAKVEAVKARYRDLLLHEQPALPLGSRSRAMTSRRDPKEGRGS